MYHRITGLAGLLLGLILALPSHAQPTFDWLNTIYGEQQFLLQAIGTDSAGNIYSAGDFRDTATFNIGSSTTGHKVVGGNDYCVQKWSPSGQLLWMINSGQAGSERLFDMVVDPQGYTYFCGRFYGTLDVDPGSGVHLLTAVTSNYVSNGYVVKLDPSGNFVWGKNVGGEAHALDVNDQGEVFVTGIFWGTVDFEPGPGMTQLTSQGTQPDMFVQKLDAQGDFLWAKPVSSSFAIWSNDIAVDGNNVVVSGDLGGIADFDPGPGVAQLNSGTGKDYFILKWDDNGNYVWAKASGSSSSTVHAHAVKIGPGGSIYFSGDFTATADFDPDTGVFNLVNPFSGVYQTYLAKLDQNGQFEWAAMNAGITYYPHGTMTIDSAGNVYQTGSFSYTVDFDPGPGIHNVTASSGTVLSDSYVWKLGPDGSFRWVHTLGGTDSERGTCIATTTDGKIYMAGRFRGQVDFDPGPGQVLQTGSVANVANTIYFLGMQQCTPSTSVTSVVACDSFAGFTGNQHWTSSGTYVEHLFSSEGCDSVVTINLSIRTSSADTIYPTACSSYTSPSGNYTWSATGVYEDTLVNNLGCDSLLTIDLTMVPFPTASISPVACDHYVSPSGNFTWTSSGTYLDTLPGVGDCDTVLTVNLTIDQSTSAIFADTGCGSYVSPSGLYTWTSSGAYFDTLFGAASNGCDSMITVQLSIPFFDTTISQLGGQLAISNFSNTTFQWYDCSNGYVPIQGATNNLFQPSSSGSYACVSTIGPCSDTTDCFTVVGQDEHFWPAITGGPNPTPGPYEIRLGSIYPTAEVVITNVAGQIVARYGTQNTDRLVIELTGEPGLYFAEVWLGDRRQVLKLVKSE